MRGNLASRAVALLGLCLLTTALVPLAAADQADADPSIKITRPEAGATYVNDAKVNAPPVQDGMSAVTGKLTIKVEWTCPRGSTADLSITARDTVNGKNHTVSNTTQSGSSSGSVAHNPPGSSLYELTAIVTCWHKDDRGQRVEDGSAVDQRRVLWVDLN